MDTNEYYRLEIVKRKDDQIIDFLYSYPLTGSKKVLQRQVKQALKNYSYDEMEIYIYHGTPEDKERNYSGNINPKTLQV